MSESEDLVVPALVESAAEPIVEIKPAPAPEPAPEPVATPVGNALAALLRKWGAKKAMRGGLPRAMVAKALVRAGAPEGELAMGAANSAHNPLKALAAQGPFRADDGLLYRLVVKPADTPGEVSDDIKPGSAAWEAARLAHPNRRYVIEVGRS